MSTSKCIKIKKVTKINSGFSDEFKIYKILLWPCGLWPLHKLNTFGRIRYILAISSQVFLFISLVIEIIKKCAKPADMIDYYAFIGVSILSSVKLISLRKNFIKVSNSLLFAQNNWITFTDNDLIEIMKKFARPAKCFYYFLTTAAYFIIVQYGFFPIFLPRNDTSNLPIQTVCTFANLDNTKHYLMHIYECAAIYYAAVSFLGIDTFFLGWVMHLCGQLKILEVQYIKIGQSICYSAYLQQITDLAEKHCHLIALIGDLKGTFSFVLLLQFLVTSFLITSQGLALIVAVKARDLFFAVKCAQALPILIMVFLIYCYCGQLIEYYSTNVNRSIYCSYWYLLSPKIRRYLRFSMLQAVKPMRLTAGKLFDVNMNSFISFVKYMFSFFSIVSLMFDK